MDCLCKQLKRLFEVMQYATHYPNRGARLRVIGEVTEPIVFARILEHVKARTGAAFSRLLQGGSVM